MAPGIVLLVLGAVVAMAALYQVVVAAAALFHENDPRAEQAASRRVVVLIPAHNEAALIARSVRTLAAQSYPSDLYRIVVIADNCTDDTAAIAEAAGATVLVRDDPANRGKGQALRWALDRVLDTDVDAVAVVDADSVAVPDFLERLVRPLAAGAVAVQGESLLSDEGHPAAALRAAAFLLVNRVRPAGRAVLGLPSHLAGNGMLFAREVLEAHPWDAFTSAEDLEYAVKLRAAGIRPVFARGAILYSPAAPNPEAAAGQQLRWEGGKFHLARTQIPRLLAGALSTRKLTMVDAALELALPPLGVLTMAAAAGSALGLVLIATGVVPWWSSVTWFAALVAVPVYVLVGFRAAGAPRSAYRVLATTPAFLVRKVLQLHRVFAFKADTWVRTERGDD